MTAALAFFIGLPLALAITYAIGIQYQRESLWTWVRFVCMCVAVAAIFIDVIAQWTVLSLYLWEWPKHQEYTFSDRLERLVNDTGWRGAIARPIALVLNWIAPPGHPHIINAAKGLAT